LIRFQKAIQNMLEMFDNDRIFIAPDLDINKLMEEGFSYDEIESKINEKGGNNKEFKASAFKKEFYNLLVEDKEKINSLVKGWKKVNTDPKLIEFTKQIKNQFFAKKKNPSGKLVIFTESKETAQELSKQLKEAGGHSILTISAENRQVMESTIRNNFDAN